MQLDAKGAVPALSCMRRRNCVRDTHLFRAKSACKWAFLIPGIIEVSHSIDYHFQALPSAPLFGRETESCLTQSDASQSVHGGATAVKQRISFKSLNSNYITSRALRTSSCEHATFTTSLKPITLKTANMVYTLVVHLYAKDDAECISKLVTKLQEASQVYSNDKETLGW